MDVNILFIYAVLAVFVVMWISHRRDHEFGLRSREFNLFRMTEGGGVIKLATMRDWGVGGGLSLFNNKEQEAASLGMCKPADELDFKAIPTLWLKGRCQLLLFDENDRPRASLSLSDKGEPSLFFYDDAGNVIWRAP